jgi:hypothetical protein
MWGIWATVQRNERYELMGIRRNNNPAVEGGLGRRTSGVSAGVWLGNVRPLETD